MFILLAGFDSLGAVFGALLSAALISKYGHKTTMLWTLPAVALSWILLGIATLPGLLLLSRIIHGVFRVLAVACGPSYAAEILHFTIRGRYSSMLFLFKTVGMFSVAVMGSIEISWRNICLIYGTVTLVIPFIGLFLIPQSPRWLASKGRVNDSLKSLEFYRGVKHNNEKELNDILAQKQERTTSNKCNIIKTLFCYSENRKFLVILALNLLHCLAGNIQVTAFSVQILDSFDFNFNSYYAASLCYLIKIVSSLILIIIADRFGSKHTFGVSTLLSSICMFTLAIYHYLRLNAIDVSKFFWIPAIALILFHACSTVNMSSLWLLRNELLPSSLRPVGIGTLLFCSNLIAFIAVSLHAPMFLYLGPHWTFLVYALSCLVSSIITAIFVPQTKNRTLEEINKN